MNRRINLVSTVVLLLLALCPAHAQHSAAEAPKPQHPLDPLTAGEYWTINDTLRASGHLGDDTLFASLLLHEPDKDKVLVWREGQPFSREADVVLIDKGRAFEARVDIAGAKVESWREVPAAQAPITQVEEDAVADEAKKDPRVLAALKRRGIKFKNTINIRNL